MFAMAFAPYACASRERGRAAGTPIKTFAVPIERAEKPALLSLLGRKNE
jgi:hypothetical protein